MKRDAAGVNTVSGIVVGLLFLLAPLAAQEKAGDSPVPEVVQYGPARQLCTLADSEIRESSGIACSRVSDGVFWTHNDSGDGPRLFAFNSRGASLGTFLIAGTEAQDWEDLASFKRGKNGFLLIGDTGDNSENRRECALYLVGESVLRGAVPGQPSLKAVMRIRFRYQDGPHNCESIAVDPVAGIIYLVSKTAQPQCMVYALPLPAADSPTVFVATPVATLKLPTTTAMDISPDGLRAVVLTYGDAYEFTRRPKETWTQAFSRKPRRLAMPARVQGEAICYGPDGKSLYLTSEKLPCPLLEVPALGTGAGVESRPAE